MNKIITIDCGQQPRAVQVDFSIVLRGELESIEDRDLVVVLATNFRGGRFNLCDSVSERTLLNALLQGPYVKGVLLSNILFAWADETGFYHWRFTTKVRGRRLLLPRELRAGTPSLMVDEVSLSLMPDKWQDRLRSHFPDHQNRRN